LEVEEGYRAIVEIISLEPVLTFICYKDNDALFCK